MSKWSSKLCAIIIAFGLIGGLIAGRVVTVSVEKKFIPVDKEMVEKEVEESEVVVLPFAEAADLSDEELDGQFFSKSADEFVIGSVAKHYGMWSFLPAAMAIVVCLLAKQPLVALFAAVVSGGFLLGRYNIIDAVLMPALASDDGAGILLLYLWLLGALLGVWSRNGAAEAFARWATENLVRGPRSAKLVAWGLGILFFQGGTVSTVMVGTTVKPVADRQRISHEELSYIVDSTASPIAILIAFNAWPGYVQALLFVPGVAYLATESSRLTFFFQSLPYSFYAWFAVLGTFLLSIDKAPLLGKKMRQAIKRSRETGQLDDPDASPVLSPELKASQVPEGYTPSVVEFALPTGLLIVIAVGTFLRSGSPDVRNAFGIAALVAAIVTLCRGMSLGDLLDGIGDGLKGVVGASVILLLAVTLGGITKETGAAGYLVEQLGGGIAYWCLPALLFLLTVTIAFSTGTSWGTYAVAFPLAMPLAISIADVSQLSDSPRFVALCFAAVLNGSVMGDQCSPISDTTVLSSMTTGADLMDHVVTQIIPATAAGVLAVVLWTALAFTCA